MTPSELQSLSERVESLEQQNRRLKRIGGGLLALVVTVLAMGAAHAQDRLRTMPRYDRYVRLRGEIFGSYKSGALNVTWTDGGKAFEFSRDGKRYRYDVAERKAVEANNSNAAPANPPFGNRFPPRGAFAGRGRQVGSTTSPDGKWKASYRDRNLWLSKADGKDEIAVTTDGNEKTRVKYGTACWVYGEELGQRTAMWWSPDSKKIAFYRFDESKVRDYFLTLNHLQVQNTLDVEPFPKPGAPNPVVDVLIYDLETKKTVTVDVRDGKPFDDTVVGHYVYNVQWSPDGRELLFHRTNRRQNVMEFTACNPETGKCRVIVREEWLPSWTENHPTLRFLKDGKRFIWTSERTGWRNFYLYDLSGKLLATLTNHPFEVANIVRVDEEQGLFYYMARSGDNHMKLQLHRVGLDGKGDTRLTDPAYHHTVDLSPDGKYFTDVIQTHDAPPETRLVDGEGNVIETLSRSDLSKFEQLGLKRVELFTFKAADGTTDLYGLLHKPSDFDPNKKYPLLVSVYAGPETSGARETFTTPNPLTEFGFLVATLDSRSSGGRGKRFLDAIYLKLGVTEIDDQAEGVKVLRQRPYVDGSRVGIYGSSYGGYASVMCLLRHPDVFQAACASSPTSDWRNYDTIYTERYLWTPQENKDGYDAGNACTYAKNLKGRLMIYFGTADNNVHPAHALQLIAALQREGKSFDVQVGPDRGHSSIGTERMMEFFIENLVMRGS